MYLQATSYNLQATTYNLQATTYKLQPTSYNLKGGMPCFDRFLSWIVQNEAPYLIKKRQNYNCKHNCKQSRLIRKNAKLCTRCRLTRQTAMRLLKPASAEPRVIFAG